MVLLGTVPGFPGGLICRLLTKGAAWVKRGAAYYENKREQRELASLECKAAAKAMTLVSMA
jgi:hypothetical protein